MRRSEKFLSCYFWATNYVRLFLNGMPKMNKAVATKVGQKAEKNIKGPTQISRLRSVHSLSISRRRRITTRGSPSEHGDSALEFGQSIRIGMLARFVLLVDLNLRMLKPISTELRVYDSEQSREIFVKSLGSLFKRFSSKEGSFLVKN